MDLELKAKRLENEKLNAAKKKADEEAAENLRLKELEAQKLELKLK